MQSIQTQFINRIHRFGNAPQALAAADGQVAKPPVNPSGQADCFIKQQSSSTPSQAIPPVPLPLWLQKPSADIENATFEAHAKAVYKRWMDFEGIPADVQPHMPEVAIDKDQHLQQSVFGGGFVGGLYQILLNKSLILDSQENNPLEEIVPHEGVHALNHILRMRLLQQHWQETRQKMQEKVRHQMRSGELDAVIVGLYYDQAQEKITKLDYLPPPPLTIQQRSELSQFLQTVWDEADRWIELRPGMLGCYQLNEAGKKAFSPWLKQHASTLQKAMGCQTLAETESLLLDYVNASLSGANIQSIDYYRKFYTKFPSEVLLDKPLNDTEKQHALHSYLNASDHIDGNLKLQYPYPGNSGAQTMFAYHIGSPEEQQARLRAYAFQLHENKQLLKSPTLSPEARAAIESKNQQLLASKALVEKAQQLAAIRNELAQLPKSLEVEAERFRLLRQLPQSSTITLEKMTLEKRKEMDTHNQALLDLVNEFNQAQGTPEVWTVKKTFLQPDKWKQHLLATRKRLVESTNPKDQEALKMLQTRAKKVVQFSREMAAYGPQLGHINARLTELNKLENRLAASPETTQKIAQYRKLWDEMKALAPAANPEFAWLKDLPPME